MRMRADPRWAVLLSVLAIAGCRSNPSNGQGSQDVTRDTGSSETAYDGSSADLLTVAPQEGVCALFRAASEEFTDICSGTGRIGCVNPDGTCGSNWKAAEFEITWGEFSQLYEGARPKCHLDPADPGFSIDAVVTKIRSMPPTAEQVVQTFIEAEVDSGVASPCGTVIHVNALNGVAPSFAVGDRFRYARRIVFPLIENETFGTTTVRDMSNDLLFFRGFSVAAGPGDDLYASDISLDVGGFVCEGDDNWALGKLTVSYKGRACTTESRSFRCCTFGPGQQYELVNHSTVLGLKRTHQGKAGTSVMLTKRGFFKSVKMD